ncbi:hypothetical protein [Pseudonocardia parietis]|uniref:Uncharacterized protein n=1 Tax=Pseudonocardia parietis TaxID=570936 RepID=A0ABS4W2U9_9PSEU|nr:hypothetical protein [Pseudonocardia parietis]MBP2370268.1 hypothetical protein [Pseudonocardia parietis]
MSGVDDDPVQVQTDPALVTSDDVHLVLDEEGAEGVADWIRSMAPAVPDTEAVRRALARDDHTALRAALARDVPAPAGRDLTAQDVRDTQDTWSGGTAQEYRQFAADYLTRVARPSGGVGQPDTALVTELCDELGVERGELVDTVQRHRLVNMAFDQCVDEEVVRRAAAEPDMTKHAAPEELLTLDELIANVENALECAAIEVVVWETDTTGARTIEAPNPLYRLTRCLRSYGLLDERRDRGEDAEDDTTETRVEWRVTAVIPSGGEVAEEFFFEDDAKDQVGRWWACAWHDIRIWSRTVSTTTRTTAWKAEQ